MSNLESIVPPLGLCAKIPNGAFADSVLVWVADDYLPAAEVVCRAESSGEDIVIPAPTLQEILAVIPPDALADFYINATDSGYKVDMIANNRSTTIANGDNPATAALNVWIELNKKGKQ